MLSVETPPGPPCSCKALAAQGDERAHPPDQRLGFPPEADPAAGVGEADQTTPFSIRGYVLSSRSKDIGTNWPFPKHYLQLCLKHGVRNLLPPFEPPDLVRARYSQNLGESQQPVSCSEVEGDPDEVELGRSRSTNPLEGKSGALKYDHSDLAHELALGSSDQAPHPPLSDDEVVHGDGEIESTVTSHDQTAGSIPSPVSEEVPHSLQETGVVLEASVQVEAVKHHSSSDKVGSLREPTEKKCRLIVKFGGNPDPNRAEDLAPNSSSVLDSMASKVCPVCRTFSSTSNTTLNAHIDQCLSVESSTIEDVSKLSKHKVKPRKKRSMVEILATAPRCTLEDLDRRNGTNWALDLTLVAPVNEVSSTCKIKRSRICPLDNPTSESEGAVYVDSNGTKLRILSKFSDGAPASSVDCPKPKKFRVERREGKSFLFGKKCFPSRHKTFLKAKVQSRKMSSFKKLKGKMYKASEGNIHMDMSHVEGSTSKPSIVQENRSSVKAGTLGQWVCSKRSGLSKHLKGKLKDRRPRSMLVINQHTSVEGDMPIAGDSYEVRGCTEKFSRPSDDFTSHVKTRSVHVLSNTTNGSDDQEKHSANPLQKHSGPVVSTSSATRGLLLKISRASGNYVSSARRKREPGTHSNVIPKSDKSGNSRVEISEKCHPFSQKAKEHSRKSILLERSQYPMEAVECTEVVKTEVPKNLRKRRSAEKSGKQAEKLTSIVTKEFHGTPDLGLARNNISGTLKSNFSVNITRPETRETFDHLSPSPSNATDPKQGDDDDDSYALDGGECITLSQVQPGVEHHHMEVAQIDAQDEVSAGMALVIKSSFERDVGTCDRNRAVTCENHIATCDRLNSYPLHDDHKEPSADSEAITDASVPGLTGDQEIHCGDINQEIQRVGDQNAESRTEAASFQRSCACLTGHRNTGLELLPENSSVAFGRTVSVQHPNMVIDVERSQSPVSAASSVSHQSLEELKFKNAEPESSQSPVAMQGKMRSEYSSNLAFLMDERVRGTEAVLLEKKTQGVRAITPLAEPENSSDGLLCCCSRRESIPQESQHSRQSFMAGMTLPQKQMASSLSIRPVISSSGACSNFRSEAIAAPVLESPSSSISAKPSSVFHLGFPTNSDFGLESPSSCNQAQSTSNSVLRLMGKNLMVNREEQPVQQHQSDLFSSRDTSDAKPLSLLGFSSACSLSNLDNIYHPHQFPEGCMFERQHSPNTQVAILPPTGRMGYFVGTPLDNGLKTKPGSQAHERRWNGEPNSSIYGIGKVCPHQRQKASSVTRTPFPDSEIIVIDDSSEVEIESGGSLPSPASTLALNSSGSDHRQGRPFCFPSQSPPQLRELGHGPKPGFPVSCPRTNTNFTRWGGISGSLPPSSFVVPSLSAGYLTPTVYYSTNFQ